MIYQFDFRDFDKSDAVEKINLTFDGPFIIHKMNEISKLGNSVTFEASFEFQAAVVPTGNWYEILQGI